MSDPYIGEIRLLPFQFAPKNWANCDGQILPTQQNQALFSLLGYCYGGSAPDTFALPDLRGRLAMGQGQGPTLSNRLIGQSIGVEQVTLTSDQMPTHYHNLQASTGTATTDSPVGAVPAQGPLAFYSSSLDLAKEAVPEMIGVTGGGQGHSNIMPYMALRYCICIFGIYPSRQ